MMHHIACWKFDVRTPCSLVDAVFTMLHCLSSNVDDLSRSSQSAHLSDLQMVPSLLMAVP